MKAWWANLADRERRTLSMGALLAAVLLGYGVLWSPLEASRDAWRTRASAADANWAWMQAAAERIKQSAPTAVVAPHDRRSLLAVVDAGIRDAGLAGALLRVEPVDATQVRVHFQQASFNALTDWLQSLSASRGIRVIELSVQRGAGVGLVDARLALEAPAP